MSLKPYYEHSGITIYHGDCREVLPELGEFDLLLTDPPYGIGSKMQGGTWGAKEKYADFRRWDTAPEAEVFGLLLSMCREAIIWGGNYFHLPPSRCWLVWDKINAVPTMADAELAWTNFDRPVKRLSSPVGVHEFGHPTQKPLPLFSWCLTQSKSVTSILDPFVGSGTSLVAAKDRGIRAVGIEAEERYCEIAARRLAQDSLFAEETGRPQGVQA